MFVEFLVN